MLSYSVYGIIEEALFQKCREAVVHVTENGSSTVRLTLVEEVPRDFYGRRDRWVAEGALKSPDTKVVAVCDSDGSVLTGDEFLTKIQEITNFRVLTTGEWSADSQAVLAEKAWRKFLRDRGNRYCWMDIKIGEESAGRILFECYSKLLPRTSQNFCALCRGDMDDVTSTEGGETVKLSYRGTTFFRILKDAWVMAGDVTPGHTGEKGYSIYGRHFPDESFAVGHDDKGILGMCNDGEHTNSSPFYITQKKMSWMNGHYVAFGRVIDGMSVVDAIHSTDVKHNQAPRTTITIEDCGEMDVSF